MPAQHNLMRSTNTMSILNHIRVHGGSTRREIQLATGLSWAAVSTIAADLLAQEILVEKATEERVSGRNPNLLDFNPRRNLSVGAEINMEGLTVVLLDLHSKVIYEQEELLEKPERNAVLNQLTRMIEEVLRINRLERSQLLGIGISVQGSVDKEGAISVYNHYIRDWRDVPMKALFEEYFGIPVCVMHDPVCIALAEQWQHKFLEQEDFVLIRLAYGIGMSYMYKGRPLNGHEGSAGEFGHMVVNCNGEGCSCGNDGCLEAYCSIRGIARRIYEATVSASERADKPFVDDDILFLKELLVNAAQMANSGNLLMRKIFDDAGKYLGIGIANVINLLNSKYVVLTGGVLDASDLLVEQAKAHARKNAWHISTFELIISRESRLRASMGAALKYINDAFDNVESCLLRK